MTRILLFLFLAASLTCCGNPSPPPPSNRSATNLSPTTPTWETYTFPEAGFAIDAPFTPDDVPYAGQPGYSQAWGWPVANPYVELFIAIQELPTFIHTEDAQKRIMLASAEVVMEKSGVSEYVIAWQEIDARLVLLLTGKNKEGRQVMFRCVMANKAVYMLITTETRDSDASLVAQRFMNSFVLLPDSPTAIPNAAAAENAPIFVDQALLEQHDADLQTMMSDAFASRENLHRGIEYEGEYNQPELTEVQETRLRRVVESLGDNYPLPWETWVHDVRLQLDPADRTILSWGRVCLAWQDVEAPDWPSGLNDYAISALYWCERVSPEKAKQIMDSYAFTPELQDQFLKSLQQYRDAEVLQWLDTSGTFSN